MKTRIATRLTVAGVLIVVIAYLLRRYEGVAVVLLVLLVTIKTVFAIIARSQSIFPPRNGGGQCPPGAALPGPPRGRPPTLSAAAEGKYQSALILLVSGIVIFAFAGYETYVEPLLWFERVKRESVRLLQTAKTQDDLSSHLAHGAMVEPLEGGWIAIRYRDPHSHHCALPPHDTSESVAVAYDSDGRWFACKGNFCRRLASIAQELTNNRLISRENSLTSSNGTTNVDSGHLMPRADELIPLFTATNLDAARRQLLAIGFHEFSP